MQLECLRGPMSAQCRLRKVKSKLSFTRSGVNAKVVQAELWWEYR